MTTALDRGLQLLEILAKAAGQPVGFNKLQEEMGGAPKASLARLLHALQYDGYIMKTSDGYLCGERMGIFACLRHPERREDLIQRWHPFMDSLTRKHDITCLLLERVGDIPICIDRTLTDYSPRMQSVGFRNHQAEHIWYQTLIASVPELRHLFRQRFPKHSKAMEAIVDQGYAYDDRKFRPDMRRLAFPIWGEDGKTCVGVFGIGGGIHQISDSILPEITDLIRKATS